MTKQLEKEREGGGIHWGMSYIVWRGPDGRRWIEVSDADRASNEAQGVDFSGFDNIGDANAAAVVAAAFRSSLWD